MKGDVLIVTADLQNRRRSKDRGCRVLYDFGSREAQDQVSSNINEGC